MSSRRHLTLTTALRMLVGLIWIAGAAVNISWSLRHPSAFSDALATDATFSIFRWFFGDVVASAPTLWISQLIVVELGLGILTLSRGTLARIGLAGSAVFSVVLFFVIWPYTFMMGVFALLPAWLLRATHSTNVRDLYHRRSDSGLHMTGSGA